jgi:pyruvate dehydrogenase E2 component (dihydrolipoamide acetyltransferase)
MPSLLRMPAPAAGVHDALLLEWSVDESASFSTSDVMAVIETDKAVIEIEAEADGVLHRRLVPAGRRVDVGTPIAVIGDPGDSDADIDALAAQAGGPVTDGDAGPAVPAPGGDGARRGGDETGRGGSGSAGDAGSDRDRSGAAGGAAGSSVAAPTGEPVAAAMNGQRIFASPIARRMAKDAGLTLAELTGTGPGGRIVRRDVQAAMAGRQRPAPAAPAPAAAGPAAGIAERSFTDIPHSRIRTAIAARLTESKQTVPHFYLRATARVDALLALRGELNTGGGPKVSVNDLVVRAVARAHCAVPEMNATFTDSAIRRYHYVDVAVAIATDDGLLTPVIRDADRLSITDIAAATADVAQRARHGRLRQQELERGSITVTNLGMFGVEEFAAIINPPQSAILAVGAARREPVVSSSAEIGAAATELVAATVMHLTLSVDHRPLDGVVAARWMAALTDLLEHPVRILA